MFVQVIQGQVSDADGVHAALDRWAQDLAPGADGWLGSTAGVTDEGTFMALARFESAEAARRNSDRPEQDQWWAETSKLFSGEVTFAETDQVIVDLPGDPGTAGFVQIMRGRVSDPKRAQELAQLNSPEWAAFRTDIVGSVEADQPDGAYTIAIYFTSEAEARAGEREEEPERLKAQMDELNSLNVEPVRFYDLKRPWLYAPR